MHDITIRRADPRDAKSLAAIGQAALKRGIVSALPSSVNDRIAPQAFEVFANTQHDLITLAQSGGDILGFAHSKAGSNIVTDLWVNAQHQGQGIALALLRPIEKALAELGHRCIALHVMTSDTRRVGQSLYQGYRIKRQGLRMDPALALPLHTTELHKILLRS